MTKRDGIHALLLLAVLLLGAALLAALGARMGRQFKSSERTVTSKGFTQKRVTSDWATWSAEITARFPQMEPAYQKIESDSKIVTDYLNSHRVSGESLVLGGITIFPKYKTKEGSGETNEIESYELRRAISVQSRDVKLLDQLSKEITSLIKQGVEIKSMAPKYYYSAIEDLKIEMLADAARDAKVKAERIAASGGAALDGLFSAQQGVFQVTPIYSFEVSDEGSFDTTSIDKTVRAIVTAKFVVK